MGRGNERHFIERGDFVDIKKIGGDLENYKRKVHRDLNAVFLRILPNNGVPVNRILIS